MAAPAAWERLKIDETAWLVPRTIGCPGACWKQPRVTVLAVAHPYVTVALPDGTPLKVHVDNVRRTEPQAAPERRSTPRPRPVLPGAEEVPLW